MLGRSFAPARKRIVTTLSLNDKVVKPPHNAWKIELELQNKAELVEVGREKQAHGQTAPGKTLLSLNDKSVEPAHNTRETIATTLKMSTGKIAPARKKSILSAMAMPTMAGRSLVRARKR